jgi:chemotaxis protein methyltransferase CheR
MNETSAFQYIIDLIYERSGIRLHDGKRELIKARLGKRMRLHGFTELSAYCEFLQSSDDEEELTKVVDSLTTNFTHFLREEDHLKFMVTQALPAVCGNSRKQFKVWCAACASGEEAYSIGMYLSEHFPVQNGWDWSVLATDISTKALGVATQGIYAAQKLGPLPTQWQRSYFQRGRNKWEGHFRIKPELAERIVFRQINLLKPYEFSDQFAVIFCRNVMIYFDRPTQEALMNRLSQYLMAGGYLIVGHAESLTGLSVPLQRVSPSIYRKA